MATQVLICLCAPSTAAASTGPMNPFLFSLRPARCRQCGLGQLPGVPNGWQAPFLKTKSLRHMQAHRRMRIWQDRYQPSRLSMSNKTQTFAHSTDSLAGAKTDLGHTDFDISFVGQSLGYPAATFTVGGLGHPQSGSCTTTVHYSDSTRYRSAGHAACSPNVHVLLITCHNLLVYSSRYKTLSCKVLYPPLA